MRTTYDVHLSHSTNSWEVKRDNSGDPHWLTIGAHEDHKGYDGLAIQFFGTPEQLDEQLLGLISSAFKVRCSTPIKQLAHSHLLAKAVAILAHELATQDPDEWETLVRKMSGKCIAKDCTEDVAVDEWSPEHDDRLELSHCADHIDPEPYAGYEYIGADGYGRVAI